MNGLETVAVSCPYCGEGIVLQIDLSIASQEYIEDCEVCCRPIAIRVTIDPDGQTEIALGRDDD